MTPAQCRAARGLIRWTQPDLAQAAGVSDVTVRKFENDQATPQRASLDVIRRALEAAGVLFIPEDTHGPGVRLLHTAAFEIMLASLIKVHSLNEGTSFAEVIVDHCSEEERHALAQALGDRLWGRENKPSDARGREIQDRIMRTGAFRV